VITIDTAALRLRIVGYLSVYGDRIGEGCSRRSVHSLFFLARDAFVGTNRRAIAMMFVRLSDHTVHCSVDLSLWWIVQCPGHPDTKACPPTFSRLFPVPPGRDGCAVWYLKKGWVEDRG